MHISNLCNDLVKKVFDDKGPDGQASHPCDPDAPPMKLSLCATALYYK